MIGKRIKGGLLALTMTVGLLFAGSVYAQDADSTISSLLQQIRALQEQIEAIQAQQSSDSSGSNDLVIVYGNGDPDNIACLNLTRTLFRSHSDTASVERLQRFLQSRPEAAWPSGVAATGFYGSLTEAAVKRLQAHHGVVSSGSPETTGYGLVGPSTRNLIRTLSCSTTTTSPGESAPNPQSILSVALHSDRGGVTWRVSNPNTSFSNSFQIEAIRTFQTDGQGHGRDSERYVLKSNHQGFNFDFEETDVYESLHRGQYFISVCDVSGLCGRSGLFEISDAITEVQDVRYFYGSNFFTDSRGSFTRFVRPDNSAARWEERAPSGFVFNFREYRNNASHYYLEDASRGVLIEIPREGGMSRIAINNNDSVWRNLYPLTKEGSTNRPPTISSVSGPTGLNVNQQGRWTVSASDPEGGSLSYRVVWGDESTRAQSSAAGDAAFSQTASFTHTYTSAGAYRPTFYVRDNAGNVESSSLSVRVGADTSSNAISLSPSSAKVGEAVDVSGALGGAISSTGNTILMNGMVAARNVVANGDSGVSRVFLRFNIPTTLEPDGSCTRINGALACPGIVQGHTTVTPGSYRVQVKNANLELSEVATLRVLASDLDEVVLSVSADKSVYAPGDRIKLTLTAKNPNNEPITLNFNSPSAICQASFSIEGIVSLLAPLCLNQASEVIIPAGGIHTWGYSVTANENGDKYPSERLVRANLYGYGEALTKIKIEDSSSTRANPTVTAPTGGTFVIGQDSMTIKWTNNINAGSHGPMSMQLVPRDGVSRMHSLHNALNGKGVGAHSFTWTVAPRIFGNEVTPGKYAIQVCYPSIGNYTGCHWSGTFSLVDAATSDVFSLSSVTPGSASTGSTVTLEGKGFSSTDKVYFGGYEITSNYISNTKRQFRVPTSLSRTVCSGLLCTSGALIQVTPGPYSLKLVDASGQETREVTFIVSGGIVIDEDLKINTVTPGSGPSGTSVEIKGTGFNEFTEVLFGGVAIGVAGGPVVDSNTIIFSVPDKVSLGSNSIQLRKLRPNFETSNVVYFTVTGSNVEDFRIAAITPGSGEVGTLVGIGGFDFDSSDELYFGGYKIASSYIDSNNRRFNVPTHVSNTVCSGFVCTSGANLEVTAGPYEIKIKKSDGREAKGGSFIVTGGGLVIGGEDFVARNGVTMTRARAAHLFADKLNYNTNFSRQSFSDVPTSYKEHPYIEALWANGVTVGCVASPLRYCPNDQLTRGQLATFLAKAGNLGATNPSTPSFSDVPRTHQFYPFIESVKNAGVMVGYGNGNFGPDGTITEDVAASLVNRLPNVQGASTYSFDFIQSELDRIRQSIFGLY